MIPKNSEIRFEIINQCNYNCVICTKNILNRPRTVMSYSLFKGMLDKVLEETDQYKNVNFAGMGEPTLNPKLTSMIRYIADKGLRSLLITNGSTLDYNRFLELQDAGLYSVRVSFHGVTPRGYSRLHGVPEKQFNFVKNNLDFIFKNVKNRKTKILLACVLAKGVNDEDYQPWIDMWKDKADLLEVWRAHNWIDSLNFRKNQKDKAKTCGRILNGPLQIQVDGTVNACCFDYDGKLVYGDLKSQRLSGIFASMNYDRIAWCHKSGDYKNSNLICENCDQRNKDKSEAIIYSSKYDLEDRVKLTSTSYDRVTE